MVNNSFRIVVSCAECLRAASMELLCLVRLRRAGDVNFTYSQVVLCVCCRREHSLVFCVCAAGGSTPGGIDVLGRTLRVTCFYPDV